jgi:DNA-nicking Smr family endonuclease
LNDKISKKDRQDWNKFISSKESLKSKDEDFIKNKKKKIRHIDLHGYTLDEANKKIDLFISECFSEFVNKIIVITGKGIHSENEQNPYVSKKLSILKYSVPQYIQNNKILMKLIHSFEKASIEDGGEGAFYIYLKKNKTF